MSKRSPQTWGRILLLAACVFIARYALRATEELKDMGPPQVEGVLRLAGPEAGRPADAPGAVPVTLAGGEEGLLLQRSPHSARLWSPSRGEWVVFSENLRDHFQTSRSRP